jgi:hypothetical protein
MRRSTVVLPLVALAFLGSPTLGAAQDSKTARGTLTAMAGGSITVRVGTTDLMFQVDRKTTVEATGAGAKTRRAVEAGKPGANLADLLKIGEAVEVTYTGTGSSQHASLIRRVSSPGSAGVPGNSASGTVTVVTANSFTISGSRAGGATFTQTYIVDGKTDVIGRGAGTASKAAGGKVAFTEIVGKGDTVTVSFREEGGTVHANEVRVTAKPSR